MPQRQRHDIDGYHRKLRCGVEHSPVRDSVLDISRMSARAVGKLPAAGSECLLLGAAHTLGPWAGCCFRGADGINGHCRPTCHDSELDLSREI